MMLLICSGTELIYICVKNCLVGNSVIERQNVHVYFSLQVQREIKKHWRRRMMQRSKNMSGRSKNYHICSGEHTSNTCVPEHLDNNCNMEMKELIIPVCNVENDLKVKSSQDIDESSPILTCQK